MNHLHMTHLNDSYYMTVTSDCIQLQWHSLILIRFLVPIFAEVDDQYQVSNKLQSDFNSISPVNDFFPVNRQWIGLLSDRHTIVYSRNHWNRTWLGYTIRPLSSAAFAPRNAWRAARRCTLSRSHKGFWRNILHL